MRTSEGRVSVGVQDLAYIGAGLARPECVLATRSGTLYVSDQRGGISEIRSDGSVRLRRGVSVPEGFLPNGIALRPDGSVLIANMGEGGGLWLLGADDELKPVIDRADGIAMRFTNHVVSDRAGRTWITVCTTAPSIEAALRPDREDGFIVLMDERGVRIVADGLCVTNESVCDPSGKWLYVNETCGRRLTRFDIAADGALANRRTVAEFGEGTYPDGMALDDSGGVWVVSPMSNRVIRVDAATGAQEIMLEDSFPEITAKTEARFRDGCFRISDIRAGTDSVLTNASSIAFGGADRSTAFIGCLTGERIAVVRTSYRGVAPVHWSY